jgi:hypothetical protein
VSAVATAGRIGSGEGKAHYKRHEPESTALYKIVSENLESFLRYTREHYRKPLPKYVEREFRRFVECGILSFGFSRLRCARCGADMLVAHSCKGRGICSSCTGRRMAAAALHIVQNVLPPCPVRQWVLVVPYPVRRLLAADAKLFGAVVKIFVRVLDRFYRERAAACGIDSAKTGMLSFQQRFGGSLNAHCHVHAIVVDGVFAFDPDTPRFALWRYHGVLAAASPWRLQIVPSGEAIQSCSHALDAKPQAACNKRDKPKTERKPVGDPTLLSTGRCNDEPSSNRSWRPCTSYIPWPQLLRHCFQVDILDCPRCHSRLQPIAVIRRQDVIDRILQHLSLPLRPEQLPDANALCFDVTGEPMPDWVEGLDPEPPQADARAPPNQWDCIDPAAHEH